MEYVDDLLREMEMFAREHETPILTEAARPLFLRTVREAAPRRILELGTAIGYSALLALRELPDAEIVTIERDAAIAEAARSFFSRAGVEGRTTLLVGEAEKLLPTLSGTFDFVFIDAAKSRYPDFWLGVQPLLAPRAVVAADNVLFRGLVEGERSEEWPKHSYRTMVLQLRAYLRLVRSAEGFRTEVFPEGDGMAVSWRDE
ncbi:MAG: O-methyltransferase [Schwartzia sp.]|nr:O-methyltransferase [Schwartzia sp. (in: firmicutes)]